MKGVKPPLGYTVIEVMIVLAVSGIMFLVAANFINGKEQKTSFKTGVNELASRIQDTIEQVSDGAYSDIPFSCSVSGTSLNIALSSDPTKTQGTNPDCVFVGKFIHFNVGDDHSAYEVFSLAAARSSTMLGPDVTPVDSGGIDLTSQQTIPQHLNFVSTGINAGIRITGKPGRYYGFGLAQSQGNAVAAPPTNGAQTVGLVYSPALNSSTDDEPAAANAITGTVANARGASFYVTDGQDTDTAENCAQITIGGTGGANPLAVNVSIKAPGTCY